ncbi:unnamed protein product [Cylicocyclus nassatus]|uniref:L-Fucosyltransferase n=1 Tax=Cylicocyclus nassatus TaxID=53992 RepID=A0AA36H8D5_CYLNA|nr:unnamed protein product [Cylicocyclus nassatus]
MSTFQKGTKQRVVKFAKKPDFFVDPSRLRNLTDQFLLLDFVFGQNPRYFEDYATDVRAILQFSKEMKHNGSMTTSFLRSHSDSMCIHVRMTDFIRLKWQTDMNITVKAAIPLAKRKNITRFLIFGDDQQFMTNMSQAIIKDGRFENDAVIVSNYHESMDLYLSSQMCRSFLISAAVSTFGWWLAFFAKDQSAVCYLNVTRPNALVRRRDFFYENLALVSR